MPPVLTQEAPPSRLTRFRAALRSVSLVQWVLTAMLAVGVLAFVRAFAGGEGVAVQRLAWGSLAWTFPLLWDLTAVIGSTLWIAAPRRTAAFWWGVFLNLVSTNVSGLATGSQAYALARDVLPGGWPVPAFIAGYAVPVLYSILTWAAASARVALTNGARWTSASMSSPASAPGTADAASVTAGPSSTGTSSAPAEGLATPYALQATPAAPLPSGSATPPPTERLSGTSSTAPPATLPNTPPPAAPTTDAPSASAGAGTQPIVTDPDAGAPTQSAPSAPEPPPSTGPTELQGERSPEPGATQQDRPRSTPDERREWAVQELYRRAEAPDADALRARDVDAQFGTKDGWRVLSYAEDRFRRERVHDVPPAVGSDQ